MATIAKHITTGHRYAVLGSGLGLWARNPTFSSDPDQGTSLHLAVADENGVIRWIPTDELRIELVDGITPTSLIKQASLPR